MELPRVPEGVERPRGYHRFKIKKEDVEKYGPSEDCAGCTRVMMGDTARPHTEACRDRFAMKLMADGDTRVLRDVDRLIAQQDLAREMVRVQPAPERRDEEVEMEDGEEVGIPADGDDEDARRHEGERLAALDDRRLQLRQRPLGHGRREGARLAPHHAVASWLTRAVGGEGFFTLAAGGS